MRQKGGFKNLKLGKNIHRQMKRRGEPDRRPAKPPQSSERHKPGRT
jgi:hypothetical protein